jgi:BirA family transcriptional regulator, biotin operon repressor / biotin---[acetyl-CoA-carboxylase] ligase
VVKVNLGLPWKDALVFYSDRTGSTMEDARGLAAQGAPHGTVAMAGFQERGRGRFRDRKWVSEPGANLLFTVILHKSLIPPPLTLFPLLCGLSVSLSLKRQAGLEALVKWPNDVIADNKKIAGILCEEFGDNVLAGMGINLNQSSFGGDLAETACSLRMLIRRPSNPCVFLGGLMAELHQTLANPGRGALLEERLYGKNRVVRLLVGNPENSTQTAFDGEIEGLGPQGALLLKDLTTGEIREIHSGEIIIP